MTARTKEQETTMLGQGNLKRRAGIGQLGQKRQDRTAGTGQPEMTVEIVQPGQEREELDYSTAEMVQPLQESHDRTVGTGHL